MPFVSTTRAGLLAGAFALAIGFAGPAASADPIKIGGAFNLTGGQASLDGPAKNGAQLAIDTLNAAGGVNGTPLELVVYDGKTDPAVVASLGSQLINSDKVSAIIGFSDSDPVLALGPNAQKAGVPFIAVGATSPKLPDQIGDTMFLACFGDNTQAAVGASFAIDDLKAKSVYVLEDTANEYATLLSKYFRETFEHLGGKVIGRDTYRTGDKSFTAQITKIKAAAEKPDILYIAATPDSIGLVVRQVRQAGLKLPIVGGDGYDTPLLLEVGGASANNVYFTTHSFVSDSAPGPMKAFFDAYGKAYGTAPENAFAALGYDTVMLVADAIKRAGSGDPAAIRKALTETKDLAGVTGAITFAEGSRVPVKSVTVIGVKDKALYKAAEMAPTFVPKP
ncbi:amino acid ABC transporter substrate-binding protein [Rhodospirillum rubrum]|uniref:ABC transporter substrate-binding protein n=1 Tax=Rhodospirillum rubrum TaxID=1085 RepID=UPI00190493F3|nr:ABC transporter substrate-binding protein [Rhodospirillum rubrum]MBK1663477.1 amino acid ABC transporter substrate-binding protein [Rhodospirillum rubrum]MBK1675675.1 amino acid ABC transporter substrate-binding protein [Rhodospirillum rubrum]